ncbi:hypothetical protein CFC21_063420 [Triticum aestivum]|uniref:Uncharacterized protein n=2 Tax=Triticum aestivum TaxID=4565 RepID=A0A3B6JR21_WHEAT|nr:uncharacterized protein LOC123100561 [Triticum aestivum]KAF7055953.1 hypothetical protein CFC21_063420 [Triticum aestivum]
MALLLLVILYFVSASPSATLAAPKNTCKFELASIAVISCQESVQSPTPSCCEALIYAVDLEPEFELDKGSCCLCKFMAARDIPFDLPSVYRSCHGKDSDIVAGWPPYMKNCNDVCYEDDVDGHTPVPPAPFAKGKQSRKSIGLRAVVAIIIGATLIIGVLLCCVYYKCPRGKARESPATSDDDSVRGGAGVEMGVIERNLSSRNLL